MKSTTFHAIAGSFALALVGASLAAPEVARAQTQYRQKIANDPGKCAADRGPAVLVTLQGVASSTGTIRVQSYRATESDWLEKGRWLNRIEAPARTGTMRFCMPVPAPGLYGIAVRHDRNGNGKTDLSTDGGAMSNNPRLNIWNLGRPDYRKTAFRIGSGVEAISINMRYR